MSSLWTPSGEHRPEPEGPGDGDEPVEFVGPDGQPVSPEEAAAAMEQMRAVREQLANTPVADILANHVIGIWELAVLHLTPEEGQAPDLEEARLAIDAIGAIVEGLGDRLGQNAQPLRDALAQLRLAFVERSRTGGPEA